jgi:hypothetical protein
MVTQVSKPLGLAGFGMVIQQLSAVVFISFIFFKQYLEVIFSPVLWMEKLKRSLAQGHTARMQKA